MAKLYYSISEVSELLNEEQHILRYWEKEFKTLKPKKNSAGNRKYSLKDIEILKEIKHLVREKQLNVLNAKDQFETKSHKNVDNHSNQTKTTDNISIDKNSLIEVIQILKKISYTMKQI